MGFLSWIDGNFNIIQTVGIIGSLWMGIAAAHREAKAREIENLLTISEHHRELWERASERADLQRALRSDADAVEKPLTVKEEEFLNMVVVHYETGWKLAKSGGITTLGELARDVHGFFSLPLPRAVWEKTKEFRNPKFAKFVDRAMCKAAGQAKFTAGVVKGSGSVGMPG